MMDVAGEDKAAAAVVVYLGMFEDYKALAADPRESAAVVLQVRGDGAPAVRVEQAKFVRLSQPRLSGDNALLSRPQRRQNGLVEAVVVFQTRPLVPRQASVHRTQCPAGSLIEHWPNGHAGRHTYRPVVH